MKVIYETERLILKPIFSGYEEEVLSFYIRNKEFLSEWEPIREEEFYTLEFQKQQLNKELEDMERGNSKRFWIFEKGSAEIIGMINFSSIVRGVFLSCFLGYKIDKDKANKGYMTEGLTKAIDIIFEEEGLHRIEANIMPKNKRSIRVVEKLGFENEGLSKKYLKINGNWENHIHMVLLNEKL